MNRITKEKRTLALALIVEGNTINGICRMLKIGKPNLLRFLKEVGQACEDWHDRHFQDLQIARLELDEQWAYVHTHKERMTKEQKLQNPDRGDCWLWASIDPDSKAIVNWRTGKRSMDAARDFSEDLASRIVGRVQITSDKLQAYNHTIPSAFFGRIDYAQEEKKFQNVREAGHEWMKHGVNRLVGVDREAKMGNPDLRTATVCHIERFFLTMRQGNKRTARKTLAYSKSWDNHALTASIHIFVYNLVRKHETTKTTPAMALGIVDRRWALDDIVDMTDKFLKAQEDAAFEAAFANFTTRPKARRTYTPTPKDQIPAPWYHNPHGDKPEQGLTD